MLQEQESPSHYILIYNNYYTKSRCCKNMRVLPITFSFTTTTILIVDVARTRESFPSHFHLQQQLY